MARAFGFVLFPLQQLLVATSSLFVLYRMLPDFIFAASVGLLIHEGVSGFRG